VTLADLAKPATAETAQIMAMPTNLKKTAALKSAVLQQVI
jgi:hypothetical protein